jgi:hypothetical protein
MTVVAPVIRHREEKVHSSAFAPGRPAVAGGLGVGREVRGWSLREQALVPDELP